MTKANAIGYLADKRAQHFACDFEVVNRSAMDWPVYFNSARLAAQQLECLVTNADDLAVVAIERHHGRLVQKDSFAGLIDECVDGAQIYSQLISEKLLDKPHGDGSSSRIGRF